MIKRTAPFRISIIKYSLRFFLLFLFFILSGCVSVQLPGSSAAPKSKDVVYSAPAKSFRESQSPNSDVIWESAKTASTISYFSSCTENEPPLKSIRNSSLQGIEEYKISKEEEVQFDGREGLRSTVDGKLEGIPVRLEILVFKKNSCSYQLTYVSLKENYNKEIGDFNKFVTNFKVK